MACNCSRVSPGIDILISDLDDPESWVRHLVDLAHSEEYGEQITTRALKLVQTRYDWNILGQNLVETYQAWLRSP